MVRQLANYRKEKVPRTGVVSGGETQEEINTNMDRLLGRLTELFKCVGRAKVDPIHIYMDPNTKPVQQKQRKIALHFIPRLKKHLEELGGSDIWASEV